MNLANLERLLPEWKFRKEDIGPRMLMLPPDSNVWQCIGHEHGRRATAMYNDHLCGEIERALLKQEDVICVETGCMVGESLPSNEPIYLWAVNIGTHNRKFEGGDDTKLSALLQANEEYWRGK